MLPVQITVRDMSISLALETTIRKYAEKLQRYYDRILSCHVVIKVSQKRKHQGKLFDVHIDLTIPKKAFVVTHKQDQKIYTAIHKAFDAMGRQLEEYTCKRYGRLKKHPDMMREYVDESH